MALSFPCLAAKTMALLFPLLLLIDKFESINFTASMLPFFMCSMIIDIVYGVKMEDESDRKSYGRGVARWRS